MPVSGLRFSETSCSVLFSCRMRKFADPAAMLRCNWAFPQHCSQHGCRVSKLSNFTAKQYTTRCFWKHLMREIGITVTEYWFIFDQRCLVWPFHRSLRVIDSCSETARPAARLIGCFPPVCEILQMPLGAYRRTQRHILFSDYLSHALLSGYSDRFIKITFF